MSMSRTRLWLVATAGVCVLLLVATWLLLVSPRRAEAAALTEETTAVASSNQQLRARIAELREQATTLPQRKAELAVIQRQLTPVTDMARFVRDVETVAADSGLDLLGVTPAAPLAIATDGTAVDPATTAPAPAAGAATDTAADVAAAPVLVAVPVSLTVRGDYFEAALFLKKATTQLERLLLVGGVQVTANDPEAKVGDPANGLVDVTVSGQIFVFQPAGTPAAPATGTTGTTPGAAVPGAATTTSGSTS